MQTWVTPDEPYLGVFEYDGGDFYAGYLLNYIRHGLGVYIWGDSDSRYEGEFVNNRFYGKGVETGSNGFSYEGDFILSHLDGSGVMTINENYHAGDWKREVLSGMGISVYSNGDKYEGEFKNNQRHGKGVYTLVTGERLEGDWVDGEFVSYDDYVVSAEFLWI